MSIDTNLTLVSTEMDNVVYNIIGIGIEKTSQNAGLFVLIMIITSILSVVAGFISMLMGLGKLTTSDYPTSISSRDILPRLKHVGFQ